MRSRRRIENSGYGTDAYMYGIGKFVAVDVEKSFQYGPKAECKINIKRDGNILTVDKIYFLGKTPVHCLQTIDLSKVRRSTGIKGEFESLVIFANGVNLYFS